MKNFFSQLSKTNAQDYSILLERYIEKEIAQRLERLKEKDVSYKDSLARRDQLLEELYKGGSDMKEQLVFLNELEQDIRKTEMFEIFLTGFEAAQSTIV